jgi:hypothetical protein
VHPYPRCCLQTHNVHFCIHIPALNPTCIILFRQYSLANFKAAKAFSFVFDFGNFLSSSSPGFMDDSDRPQSRRSSLDSLADPAPASTLGAAAPRASGAAAPAPPGALGGGVADAILAKLEALGARMDRIERPSRAAAAEEDFSMEEAVRRVSSFPRGRSHRSAGPGIKDRLRAAGKTPRATPFRPLPSSGDDSDDDPPPRARESEASADEPQAKAIMANIRATHRTASAYVRDADFSNLRAGHEARRTAQAIDALVKDGVSLELEGMEILCRNLAGIVLADQHGNPALLEQMEWQPPQAIVSKSVLRTLMKDAERAKKFKPAGRPAPADPKKQGAGKGAGGK